MLGILIYANICNLEIETVEHLFFQCNLVQIFWNDAFCWIQQRITVRLILSWQIVKFGLLVKDKKIYVINNLLLLLKFYIHKCTFFKTPPRLVVFIKEEFVIYLETLRGMKSPNCKIFVYFIRGFWFHNVKTSYSPTSSLSLFLIFLFVI